MHKIVIGAVAFAITFIVSGTFLGLWIATERSERNSLLSRIERKATAYLRSAVTSDSSTKSEIITNRLPLTKRVINMPLLVADSGGGIAAAPGGGVLILDRLGSLFYHVDGQTSELRIDTPDNGIEDLDRRHASGEFGDGGFRKRGFRFNDVLVLKRGDAFELFISYSDWEPDRLCYRSVLAHATIPIDLAVSDWVVNENDWRELKATEPCLPISPTGGVTVQGIEAGGRLAEVSDTELVWSTGVYELDDSFKETGIEPFAQRDESDYGRVLKIDFRSGDTEVLARGLRNPQGLTRSNDGTIFVSDHGMRGGDELNVVEPDQPEYNFGWPFVSYGTHYNGTPVHSSGRHSGHDGYDLPAIAFAPSIAPGSALFLEGFHPVWDGDILIGAFRGTIERIHLVDGRAIFVEPIGIEVRPRDMALTEDREIVIWTDNLQLIFLTPRREPSAMDRMFASINEISDDGTRKDVAGAMEGCLQCHSLSKGENQAGPSLHGLCGSRMGSVSGFDQYSEALASSRQTWTEDLLAEFIMTPQSIVPDTSMSWEGTQSIETAATIARLICSNRD